MLDLILLIDDNPADNFFHTMILEEANCTRQIIAKESGEAALEYLTTAEEGRFPQPDLIFLDINMPGMSGWDFIEYYDKLPEDQKGKNLVMMLTTSLNPDDSNRAGSTPAIKEFISKPLTVEMVNEILISYNMMDRLKADQ
ncbi:MAG: response regulator [Bacteroidota bacterium]